MGRSRDMELLNKAWNTEGGRIYMHGGNIIKGRGVRPVENRRNESNR